MKKSLIALLSVAVVLAIVAYQYRTDLLLFYVSQQAQPEIGPNQEIHWQQGPVSAEQPPSERPPNIVFILADDLGINDLTAFGGGVAGGAVPTPSIDGIARDGVMFNTSYAGHGTCAPSRAMLMTGRYPTRTGFEFTPTPPGFSRMVTLMGNEMDDGLPPGDYNRELDESQPDYWTKGLPAEETTIAEVLQAGGYHTVHIGKWHLGNRNGMAPNDQGFEESLLMDSQLFAEEDDPNVVNAKLDFDPIDKFLWARGRFSARFNGGDAFTPGGYLTDYWTDESLKVIEANQHRPFFLYLAHWGVHTPLQATKEDYDAVGDLKPHRLRVYAGMVRSLDRSVRRIEEKLEALGLVDNTMIVFSSDNGGAGYIGLPEVNAPYRGWKITFFEGGIRAPIFVKWPAQIPANSTVDEPVAHIDLMPTMAAAAGAKLPNDVEVDGQNLLPVILGTGELRRPNDALYWQSGGTRVVRAGDWKLHVEGRRDEKWLFDLANDPTEQTNLADSRPDKLGELQALLDLHQAESRALLWQPATERPIAIDKTRAERVEPGDEVVYWPN
ncbi:MAG: sulfatase-like hydrolase/transferase [Pseudomonadaceae bacterium]|nr:sulfatase-like hydrolase/transferase [Pseudomonadaceae bacterium]